MLSVSSAFQYQASQKNAVWDRQLLLGTSDYSDRVLAWPTVSRSWNDINPSTVTIDLTNADKTFNLFLSDPTKMQNVGQLNIGFAALNEYINLFTGKMDSMQYADGKVTTTLVDKFKQLAAHIIGDSTTPQSYTSSAYLVHTLAWYICTSHGGLSALTSTNNPDIDYASFGSWSSIFSADNTRVQAQFTGQKAVEALQKISNLTQSAIWVENGKLKFDRFSIAAIPVTTLDDSTVVDGTIALDSRSLKNQYFVGAAYNVTSQSFAITVNDINSDSIGSYGLFQDNSMETIIWLVDSVSALNLAQRMVRTYKNLAGSYNPTSPLQAIAGTIGDTLYYGDSLAGVSGQIYRILSEDIDMENGTKTYTMDQTQLVNGFRLDFSALDSSDVLL